MCIKSCQQQSKARLLLSVRPAHKPRFHPGPPPDYCLLHRPKGQDAVSPVRGRSEDDSSSGANGHGEVAASPGGTLRPLGGGRIRFTDKDEHMYFWFPLLAGLSELTFDPRPEIRCGVVGLAGLEGGEGVRGGAGCWTTYLLLDGMP